MVECYVYALPVLPCLAAIPEYSLGENVVICQTAGHDVLFVGTKRI